MKIEQAKNLVKPVMITLVFIFGICLLGGFLFFCVEKDSQQNAKLCEPAQLEHAFAYERQTRAVCIAADGTLFVSDKIR